MSLHWTCNHRQVLTHRPASNIACSDVKADEAIPVSKAKSSAKNRKGEQKADRSAEKSDTTRSVADVAEPSTQLVGFFKGAVVGYVAMTICLSLTLLVMLLLGQNVVCRAKLAKLTKIS
jgi:hypothetical protein